MASITMHGKGDANVIASIISTEVCSSALSCEMISNIKRSAGTGTVCIMVFEKYYMRTSNRASLTVVVTSDGDDICVDAIGSGGGQGILLGFSWGANENFVGAVENVLRRNGFR